VCLLDDAAALAHGDPRHPNGLSFALHDLCHLEKFVDPEHHRGQVGTGMYSACKAGIEALTRVAANENGAAGIRVNAVAPGGMLTPSLLAVLDAAPGEGESRGRRAVGSYRGTERGGRRGDVLVQ
jgi:NAD(P)-dependent dehydrogenase (short-subunit alcohol dehydrogenase family)